MPWIPLSLRMFVAVLGLFWQTSAGADELADLIGQLKLDDPKSRSQAAKDLGRLGPKAEAAIPALVSLLGDTSSITTPDFYYTSVRSDATSALVQIGPTAVLAVIAALDNSPNPEIRVGAALALVDFSPKAKEALPAFAKALNDPNEEVRRFAAQGLALFGKQAAGQMDELSKLLHKDSSEWVRAQAAIVFRFVDPDGARSVPELIRALGDISPKVRGFAAITLGELGSKARGQFLPSLLVWTTEKNALMPTSLMLLARGRFVSTSARRSTGSVVARASRV
jgi:HEAT repeat protein